MSGVYPEDSTLSRLLPAMTTADFSRQIAFNRKRDNSTTTYIRETSWDQFRPFAVSLFDSRIEVTVAFLNFTVLCQLIHSIRLVVRFLSVRPRFCFGGLIQTAEVRSEGSADYFAGLPLLIV